MPPSTIGAPDARSSEPHESAPSLRDRLFSRRALVLLTRNTVISTLAFGIGLLVLWLLVERLGANTILAGGVSFVAANTLHYVFGRAWIFRGSNRPATTGYAFFLINGLIGLVLTLAIFAGLLALGMHYLVARIITSIFAGLVMFLSNALLNFRVL